jgi:hypothetical protein
MVFSHETIPAKTQDGVTRFFLTSRQAGVNLELPAGLPKG